MMTLLVVFKNIKSKSTKGAQLKKIYDKMNISDIISLKRSEVEMIVSLCNFIV